MNHARGRSPQIIDTNVAVVANRRHGEPYECVNSCAKAIVKLRSSGVLLVDSLGRILAEYRRNLSLAGQPGVGDAFIRWAYDNIGQRDLVQSVTITPSPDEVEDYDEFPSSASLAGFDHSDRKFVAVALAHAGNPPILNATDRDWWDYREALASAGVTVRFLCPEQFQQVGT